MILLISVILQVVILLLMSGYVFCLLLAKHGMMLKVSFIYLIVLIDLCPKKEQIDQIQVLLISQMRRYREELEIAHYLVQKEINIVRRKRYEDCAISKSGKTINVLIRI